MLMFLLNIAPRGELPAIGCYVDNTSIVFYNTFILWHKDRCHVKLYHGKQIKAVL